MPQRGRPKLFRFGVFEVDLRAGVLRKSGLKIKLQGQPFQILEMLLDQPGEAVTREELRNSLWPADTFVDFDHSLNTAIKKLRQALGDDADNPHFIETLPRRGYRFIGPVEESEAMSPPAEAAAPDLIGDVLMLCDAAGSQFVLVPVDENIEKEKEKLEAASDDLGLSLLIASGKILLVPKGTKVRVLGAGRLHGSYEVRILEGEHLGQTALVPRKYLGGLS